jgi:hypothetical protein
MTPWTIVLDVATHPDGLIVTSLTIGRFGIAGATAVARSGLSDCTAHIYLLADAGRRPEASRNVSFRSLEEGGRGV